MIADSLNIHTRRNAAEIGRMITDAERALQTAEMMLHKSGIDDNIRERLAQRNAKAPDYPTSYLSMAEIAAGALSMDKADIQRRLAGGETVVSVDSDEAGTGHYLSVIVPLFNDSGMAGALYTQLKADELLRDGSDGIVYQDAYNCLVTSDGSIVFNTYQPDHHGNLFTDLGAYGLAQAEIDRIAAAIINSRDTGSATFLRKGETYFASSAYLDYNAWHLVSFVRGPDVVLRSSTLFQDVVRTSVTAILITATAACVIFFELLNSRKKLEAEQQRNHAFAQRFQAMFNQHKALMVVTDAGTREILDVNPALLNYFGHTAEEMLGHNAQEFNLLSAEIVAERFQAGLTEDVLFAAAPYRLKNGDIRLLDVYASPVMERERKLFYAILFDVTDKERYREELIQEKERLRITLASIGDGVVTTDSVGRITGLNAVAQELTGWDTASALGRPFTDVFVLQNENTGQPAENPIRKVLASGRIIGLANHTELVNRHGKRIPIADSAAPIKAEDGETLGVVMVFRDVSDEKERSRQIEFLSYRDSLTGLYNRRYLEETMARLDAAEHLPISVIMADVNGLKITNDVFGHKAGDILLKNVASALEQCCPEHDLIARWGGDEFVIVMPETSQKEAEATIRKIRDTPVTINGSHLPVSLSIGCACKDTGDGCLHTAMQQAEKYMYQQKLLDGKSYRNAIISTLLATLYEKSNETEEHSKRLETYCHAIGRELQLSSKEMDDLSLLALLHDIGKVGIHPNILKKPGALTAAEWDEMKRHPEIGYRIAQATPELAVVADLILSHHERWDGTGYPRRLKREEIPLACRILSVVDAFDAMTNDRVYRSAMTVRDAILEIKNNAGKQFDPQAAKLLIGIIAGETD